MIQFSKYMYIKRVLRGHLWVERWPYKTGDLLKKVQFIWNFLWQDKKGQALNTGDCLIEVTTWTGFTVYDLPHQW